MAATMDTASISSSPAKVYRSRQISEQALCALDEMRRHSQLCDVVIRVDNHDFVAHRAVLAATIPYFMAMFTGKAGLILWLSLMFTTTTRIYLQWN